MINNTNYNVGVNNPMYVGQYPVQTPVYYNQQMTNGLTPLNQLAPGLGQDSYEDTRDKSFGDFAKGLIVGAGKSIYDMGAGLFTLGKGIGWVVTHPVKSVTWVGKTAVNAVTHPVQTVETIVKLPGQIVKGVVKPYSEAFKQGKYGEGIGRLGMDAAVLIMSLGIAGGSGSAKAADTTSKVANASDDVTKVATTTVEKVANVSDDVAKTTAGAINATNSISAPITVNIPINISNVGEGASVSLGNIGNEIGKITSEIVAGTTPQVVSEVAKVGTKAGEVSKVATLSQEVAKVADVASDVSKVATTTTAVTTTVGLEAKMGQWGATFGRGLDIALKAPEAIIKGAGTIIKGTGTVIKTVGGVVLHPIQSIHALTNPATWTAIHTGMITGATNIGNGLRIGADLAAKGLLFAAQNPLKASIVLGAVGRTGKAGEDVLKEMDLVR